MSDKQATDVVPPCRGLCDPCNGVRCPTDSTPPPGVPAPAEPTPPVLVGDVASGGVVLCGRPRRPGEVLLRPDGSKHVVGADGRVWPVQQPAPSQRIARRLRDRLFASRRPGLPECNCSLHDAVRGEVHADWCPRFEGHYPPASGGDA